MLLTSSIVFQPRLALPKNRTAARQPPPSAPSSFNPRQSTSDPSRPKKHLPHGPSLPKRLTTPAFPVRAVSAKQVPFSPDSSSHRPPTSEREPTLESPMLLAGHSLLPPSPTASLPKYGQSHWCKPYSPPRAPSRGPSDWHPSSAPQRQLRRFRALGPGPRPLAAGTHPGSTRHNGARNW